MSYRNDRVRLPPLQEALSRDNQNGGNGQDGQSSLKLAPIISGLRQAKSHAHLLEALPSISRLPNRSRLAPSASARDLRGNEAMQPLDFTRSSPLAGPSSPRRRSSSNFQAYNTGTTRNPSSYSQAPTAPGYSLHASTLDSQPYHTNSLASSTAIHNNITTVCPSDTMLTSMQPRPSYTMTGLLQPPAPASAFSGTSPTTLQPYSLYPSYSSSEILESPTTSTGLSQLSLTTPSLYDGLAADTQSGAQWDDMSFDLYCQGLPSSDTQSFPYNPPLVPYSADTFTLGGFVTSPPPLHDNASMGNSSLYNNELFYSGQTTSFNSENTFDPLLSPHSLVNVNSFDSGASTPFNFPFTRNFSAGNNPVRPDNSFSSVLPRDSSHYDDSFAAQPLAPLNFSTTSNPSSLSDSFPPSISTSAQDSRRRPSASTSSGFSNRSRRYLPLPPPDTLESLISNSGLFQSSVLSPSIGTSAQHDTTTLPRLNRHVCEVCGRGFSRASSLATHRLSHTGDRPFTCEVCEKAFSVASNLRRHVKIHEHLEIEQAL